MKTEIEIRERIDEIKDTYRHVLFEGSKATLRVNAPRAIMQIVGLTILRMLYWVLDEKFEHKFPKDGENT